MPTYHLIHADNAFPALPLGDKPVTIGRSPENVLILDDALLSRFHCVIEPAPARPESGELGLDETGAPSDQPALHIRDLGSRNGTKVNGQRITDAPLSPGDIIRLGTHTFTVQVEDTLKERQAAARATNSTAKPGWVIDLDELIVSLPPQGEGLNDKIEMIDARGKVSAALSGEGEGPRAVRLLLAAASKSRATDIHVEPKGDAVQVRLRVDGQMIGVVDLPNAVGAAASGLIKTACEMRPTGREAVLDGHFSARFPPTPSERGRRVDYRVSFTPSVHGQKSVVRVLDMRDAPKSLSELGLPPYQHQRVAKVCEQDSGLLLLCGPTGSGKTTTLYCAIRGIDRQRRNVVTIEDPVEYQIDNVTQIPVSDHTGNSFGSLLRSVLRQDPDVILVGEIRDEETARTAMQAAMTGHLVFSTVHAKDTMSSVFRLLDLKVEPYLVASSLEVVIAQRLLRVLCDVCKRQVPVSPSQATRIGKYLEGQHTVYTATGCAACLRTGYRGRKAIFELLDFTDELRDIILKEPTIQAMKRVIEQGMFTTLVQSGWVQAARGVTSLEEVDRVATAR
jgi:type II secretory ATPase GspE/PulE/Tfp pilus assembly ATPase PilB-like protein